MVNCSDPSDLVVERVHASWTRFVEKLAERKARQERSSEAPEESVEGVLEDLFVNVLDWSPSDVHRLEGEEGLLVSRSGAGGLIVAVRRPGALIWYRRTVEAALQQVRRQADEKGVKSIAVSDGVMLYAADIEDDQLRDRVFVYLGSSAPQTDLRWLSVHGLSRPRTGGQGVAPRLLPEMASTSASRTSAHGGLISHPRYGLPARCFAYVGNAEHPDTWKLPYLLADGRVDAKRLPKAIQSIVSNYRGERVRSIPASEIPDVLVRLARAAAALGKLPHQSRRPVQTYQRLAEALAELGRLDEVMDD